MFGCSYKYPWKGKVNDHLNNCQIAQTDKKSCEDLLYVKNIIFVGVGFTPRSHIQTQIGESDSALSIHMHTGESDSALSIHMHTGESDSALSIHMHTGKSDSALSIHTHTGESDIALSNVHAHWGV